jgi:hypothetical protein
MPFFISVHQGSQSTYIITAYSQIDLWKATHPGLLPLPKKYFTPDATFFHYRLLYIKPITWR